MENKKRGIKRIFLLSILLIASLGFVFATFDFEHGTSGNTDGTFYSTKSGPVCQIIEPTELSGIGAQWVWLDNLETSINAMINCQRTDGLSEGGIFPQPTCCPTGYECDTSPADSNTCVPVSQTIISCSEYTTSTDCENYNVLHIEDFIYSLVSEETGISLDDIPRFCTTEPFPYGTGDECVLIGGCGCVWGVDSVTGEGECLGSYNAINCVLNDDSTDPLGNEYNCATNDELTDMCADADVYKLSWTAVTRNIRTNVIIPNPAWCSDGEMTFPCPIVSVIPFFTMFNFILSGLGIVFVYFLIRKR